MSVEPSASTFDTPFPGARSQVPGRHHEMDRSTARQPQAAPLLPLGASPLPRERGWTIRLRVRAEQIEVEKRIVVRERVAVRRAAVDGSVHLKTHIRREVLKVQADGQAESSPPLRADADDNGL
jgi:stress response protein YsnF